MRRTLATRFGMFTGALLLGWIARHRRVLGERPRALH